MDEIKIIGFLFSILSVVFWRWVSSVEEKQKTLEKEIRDFEKNSLTKKEIHYELNEIKDLIKEIQTDINELYREMQIIKKN